LSNSIILKRCGRCKANIDCCSENIANCACSKVNLTIATTAFLKLTKYDCLCNNCLTKINALITQVQLQKFPTKRSEMIEGLHYYIENGYFVFTEFYHMLRGKCCQSGCRHCAYGFKN
jgi:hypothetical protein